MKFAEGESVKSMFLKKKAVHAFLFTIVAICLVSNLYGQLKENIGDKNFADWNGISKSKNNEAFFVSGDTISYTYPEGEDSFKGFREYYGNARDWSLFGGVSFEVYLKKESDVEITLSFEVDESDKSKLNPISTATIALRGIGWQSVYVPWEVFDLNGGQREGTLQGVKLLKITANSEHNQLLGIRNIGLSKAEILHVDAAIKSKALDAGDKIYYDLEVGNTSLTHQKVLLSFEKSGWESMQTSVNPSILELAPGEIKKCRVEVEAPITLPKGVRERQILNAIPNGHGGAIASIEFITAVALPHPNLVHTANEWQKVRDKIDTHQWAKDRLAEYEKGAISWEVPELATKMTKYEVTFGQHLFDTKEGSKLMNCAIAYQLTGNKDYAQKCILFLRRLSDLEKGYPVTLRGSNRNFVKEGGFFQDIGRSYDMIVDSGLLTAQDKSQIENTFRLFIKTVQMENANGGIGNWDLSEYAGAFYCALAIQDWYLVETILNAPTGIYQQMTQGVMSDGWWYECAVGYNLWCATMFSEIAIALRPWGVNFVNKELPIGTTPFYSLMPDRMKPGLYGMNFDKWGTNHKSTIGIKDMWDALIPFLDYRGVMFAVNDAKEDLVTGEPYELAYYLYGDPEYAAVVNRGEDRNLLYGVPELPNIESEKSKKSAFADNIGIVQLRSQKKGRAQREQIQAALHYGTHGGYHGHFDRTNFISMMRYGRSFYNPEMVWYSYQPYLYKFLVQTSMTKNMVVVDQKMQEPKESTRTLFYTGDMMQATAVETKARWSYPPYGGMEYYYLNGISFAEKAWLEHRSIEIPDNAPKYGSITGFTEPVQQRRLMIMMDDYVVLADYLKSDETHTFDWLFQMKGFRELTADKKNFLRHDNQMNTDPLGNAQLFTDCDWYETEGTARTKFEMCWGKDCDNAGTRVPHSEEGPLKIDVFNAWPKKSEITFATVPEPHNVAKPLWYTIIGDEEVLSNDSTGAWILGSKNIDIDISGKSQLVLSSKTKKSKTNTIFWGDAKVVLENGSEIYVTSLPITYQNILVPEQQGMDYYNGPVKIAGELMKYALPGMPENPQDTGVITIDLSSVKAVRFKSKLGGDYPLGDESSRRKTMAVRSVGNKARYLSVIEPYEQKSVIKSVMAKSANQLIVELLDGRIQEISISGIETGEIKIETQEFLNGELLRNEKSF